MEGGQWQMKVFILVFLKDGYRLEFYAVLDVSVRGLERWYLVLGGVAVGRGFEPQSDLELSFAKILI
jgi:hypothetical protein